jgi:hypothetical protein
LAAWDVHEEHVGPLRAEAVVHTPVHAGWLNQFEIYFSIVQRKVLTPKDFKSLSELKQRLLALQQPRQETASPFQWTFTRKDLATRQLLWTTSNEYPSGSKTSAA